MRLQFYRQSTLRKSCVEKLKPQFHGPIRVIQRVGEVAYELELGSKAQNLFHVARLKKALGHNVVALVKLPPLDENGKLIVYFKECKLRERSIKEHLVKMEKSSSWGCYMGKGVNSRASWFAIAWGQTILGRTTMMSLNLWPLAYFSNFL